MKINGKNIKGVKKTVGAYNKLPIAIRCAFNIWYDNVNKSVEMCNNELFNQFNMGSEYFTDELGFTFLRYDDVSDCINCEYPYLGKGNISMIMLRSVLEQYIV